MIRLQRDRITFLALLVVVAAGIECSSSVASPQRGGTLAMGTWGGEGAGVIVSDTLVHVHVGCTYGDLRAPVVLDSSGRFNVAGSYTPRAYPIAIGPSVPARFAGQVIGAILTLAVAVDDTVEHRTIALGPVTVTHNREPRMGSCPICRKPPGARPRAVPPR